MCSFACRCWMHFVIPVSGVGHFGSNSKVGVIRLCGFIFPKTPNLTRNTQLALQRAAGCSTYMYFRLDGPAIHAAEPYFFVFFLHGTLLALDFCYGLCTLFCLVHAAGIHCFGQEACSFQHAEHSFLCRLFSLDEQQALGSST